MGMTTVTLSLSSMPSKWTSLNRPSSNFCRGLSSLIAVTSPYLGQLCHEQVDLLLARAFRRQDVGGEADRAVLGDGDEVALILERAHGLGQAVHALLRDVQVLAAGD